MQLLQKMFKDYKSLTSFALTKGSNNKDGRLSKNFFGEDGKPLKTNKTNVKEKPKWKYSKYPEGSNNKIILKEEGGIQLSLSDSNSNRHCSIKYIDRVRIQKVKQCNIKFNIKVNKPYEMSSKYILILLDYYKQGVHVKNEKITLITSGVAGGETSHNIQIEGLEDTDCTVEYGFFVNKIITTEVEINNVKVVETFLKNNPERMDITDREDSPNYSIDLIAGCEVSYFCEALAKQGWRINHSYALHLAMDPVTELQDQESLFYTTDSQHLLLSQVQILRPLLFKFEQDCFKINEQDQMQAIELLIEGFRDSINRINARKN